MSFYFIALYYMRQPLLISVLSKVLSFLRDLEKSRQVKDKQDSISGSINGPLIMGNLT